MQGYYNASYNSRFSELLREKDVAGYRNGLREEFRLKEVEPAVSRFNTLLEQRQDRADFGYTRRCREAERQKEELYSQLDEWDNLMLNS